MAANIFPVEQHPQTLSVERLSIQVPVSVATHVRAYKTATCSPLPQKTIVNDVSCIVRPGQLMAVLGPSGSGKTSFLDALALRFHGGTVTGEVRFNGHLRTDEDMTSRVSYIMQSDYLMPYLTVKETLFYVARLRLAHSLSYQQKHDKVDEIISELGLRHVRDSQVGGTDDIRGISGGERRRVSIGVQLLTSPAILLCDEPTSGSLFLSQQFESETRKQYLVYLLSQGLIRSMHSMLSALSLHWRKVSELWSARFTNRAGVRKNVIRHHCASLREC
eukprot:m.176812 g.176812  ORF g.176812 m.176812 type:complete len:276 (+) comp53359_c0_seq7:38-865(+)